MGGGRRRNRRRTWREESGRQAHHCTATALPPHVIVFLLPHGPSPLHDAVGRYAEGRWSDGAGVSVGVAKSWTIGDGAMSAVVSASVAVVMVMEISMIMMLTLTLSPQMAPDRGTRLARRTDNEQDS